LLRLTSLCPENRNPYPKPIYNFLLVTESETQTNFVHPNPLHLFGIALGKDAEASAQKDLFQAIQPG
jgi:hypothetical protein